MTEKPADEKRDEQDRAALRNEDESPEVAGHRLSYGPEEPGARMRDEDESPEVEGHRFVAPEEPGVRMRGEDAEGEEGEGRAR